MQTPSKLSLISSPSAAFTKHSPKLPHTNTNNTSLSFGGNSGGYDQISSKDALMFCCLGNKVKIDFSKVIWDDLLSKLQKKHKEKVIPYSRFISLLLEHKIKDTYENPEVTNIHTPIFIVNNWTLKKDQPEGPPFTAYVLDICTTYGPEEFKSPTIPTKELKPKGKKPGAKCEHMKSIPVTKNYPGSSKEATFIGPLTKKATKALKGQSKKKKKSVMAKYKNTSVDPNP
ncbi:hypothetical protein Tco_0883861 [Tanacetum coccineum]